MNIAPAAELMSKKMCTNIILPILAGILISGLVMVVKPQWVGLEDSPAADLWERINHFLRFERASYSDAVKIAVPSVVNIATSKPVSSDERSELHPPPPFDKGRSTSVDNSLGSGVIISPDGYVLTNNHVISRAGQIVVILRDNRHTVATVVGRDPETDLAVLKINLSDLPYLKLSDSRKAEVGDVVLAIGNPFGLGQTVTMGIISATGRSDLRLHTYEDFIQTDAAINVGNSGGALVNAYGELIGISTLLFSRGGGNEGIAFAIPSSMAKFVSTSIIQHGRVIRGWLGIESQELTPRLADAYNITPSTGILISGIYKDSPADLAGLKRGDILTSINNINTNDGKKVMNMVARERPGSAVKLSIIRNDKPMEMEALITIRPNMSN